MVDAEDHGHVPVLLERCVELIAPALTRHAADGSGAVLVDATVGAGGHAERVLPEFPGLRLVGLDRDPNALAGAAQRLAPFVIAGTHILRGHTAERTISPPQADQMQPRAHQNVQFGPTKAKPGSRLKGAKKK